MKKLRLLLFFLCISLIQITKAQTGKIDSLKNVLRTLSVQNPGFKRDTLRINLLNKISRQLLFAGSFDSSLHYADQSRQLAESSGGSISVKRGLARAYNSIGLVHYYRSSYPEALKNHFIALKIQEEIMDKYGIANSYNHIGLIYYSQGRYEEALKSHEASLKIKLELNDKKGIIASHVNMGNVYHDKGDLNAALKSYYAGISAAEKMGDKQVIGTCYNNIGSAYLRQNNYSYAIKNYKKALEVREGTGDKYGDAMSYCNLSDVYCQLDNYKEAESYAKKALELATELEALELIKTANNALSNVYNKTGNYAGAFKHYKAFVTAKDSITNEQNTRKSLETQMQYDFDKKMTADSIRVAGERKILATQLSYEKNMRLVLYGGIILLIVFAVFMVNRFRVTMGQKNIIELKEKQAQKQKQIIAHQKDVVEGKQKEILDSINYALRIQRSLLASDALLNRNLRKTSEDVSDNGTHAPQNGDIYNRDYFILFKPKDIVSGDFYWAAELLNGEFALAIGDSTGHGVPGAIMSMLNIACLNEVAIKNITSPEHILYEVRKKVIEHLKNDGSQEGGKDGMDCTLLSFNFETNTLSYAGANNPLWMIRNTEFIEIKPDKMPVGKGERDQEAFTLHTVKLQKGDMVYAFTDGYSDQFGGAKGKKFTTRKFKDLLLNIAAKPISEQKKILSDSFETWKYELEQIDDVTVFGFHVM